MPTPAANLINQLQERTGLKRQNELAALISERMQVNLPAPRFSDWKRGARNPTVPQAVALADFARQYGIDVDPLTLAAVVRPSRQSSPRSQLRKLGVTYAQQSSVAVLPWPVPVLNEPGGFAPVGCAWFGDAYLKANDIDPSQAVVMWIHDDSMWQTIPNGSAFMADRRKTDLLDSRIYAMEHAGELIVRRAVRQGTAWLLVSDDPALAVMPAALGVRLIGRVVWTSRLL